MFRHTVSQLNLLFNWKYQTIWWFYQLCKITQIDRNHCLGNHFAFADTRNLELRIPLKSKLTLPGRRAGCGQHFFVCVYLRTEIAFDFFSFNPAIFFCLHTLHQPTQFAQEKKKRKIPLLHQMEKKKKKTFCKNLLSYLWGENASLQSVGVKGEILPNALVCLPLGCTYLEKWRLVPQKLVRSSICLWWKFEA